MTTMYLVLLLVCCSSSSSSRASSSSSRWSLSSKAGVGNAARRKGTSHHQPCPNKEQLLTTSAVVTNYLSANNLSANDTFPRINDDDYEVSAKETLAARRRRRRAPLVGATVLRRMHRGGHADLVNDDDDGNNNNNDDDRNRSNDERKKTPPFPPSTPGGGGGEQQQQQQYLLYRQQQYLQHRQHSGAAGMPPPPPLLSKSQQHASYPQQQHSYQRLQNPYQQQQLSSSPPPRHQQQHQQQQQHHQHQHQQYQGQDPQTPRYPPPLQQLQQQQQQQQLYNSNIPPELPNNNNNNSVQNTHLKDRIMRPNDNEEEEEEEEEIDDLPPFFDAATTTTTINDDEGVVGGEGGSTTTTTTTATTTATNVDLSQFDKDVIFSGLKKLYRKKIRPLELSSKYGHFHSPPLSPSDFTSRPMVLLLGQYSVGKTSFIRYLLGRDFPGQRIGPEPTTDRFVAILNSDASCSGGSGGDKIIPGAALCSQSDRPFRGLSMFGNNFLSRFEGVEMENCPILHNITLVDTPGILSGQKQGQYGRNYDYEQVMKWFAERADLIIIMFDAHKLDISDELKRVIELLRPHQDKVRVLLNKADSISTQQLMRVYGALMWSLGKVMLSPEVCRVYMGSFWGAPLKNKEQSILLNREKRDLFDDIARLPQDAVMRRINELVKRARSVKVHAYIMHYLRKQLPYTWGKREKQARLIDRLEREFVMCARRYELPRGDFPELEPFRRALMEMKDISSDVHKLDKKMVKEMERVFSVDIPNLLEAAKFH